MDEKELKTETPAQDEAWQALQLVREAEERARQMVEEARMRTAPDLLRRAAEEAEEARKRILAEARKQAEQLKKEIVDRARAEAGTISQQAEAEKAMILKAAENNFEQAVNRAVSRLLELVKSRKVD